MVKFLAMNAPQTKKLKVRANRYPVPSSLSASVKIAGTNFALLNYSATGLAALADTKPAPIVEGKDLPAEIVIDNVTLAKSQVRFLYQSAHEGSKQRLAFEVSGPLLDVEELRAALDATELLGDLQSRGRRAQSISAEFRHLLLETSSELNELKHHLDRVDRELAPFPSSVRHSREKAYSRIVAEFLHQRLGKFYSKLGAMLGACHRDEKGLYLDYFRRQFSDYLWQGAPALPDGTYAPGSQRSYGMIGLALSRDLEGTDLFSMSLNRYYSSLLGSRALDHRVSHLGGAVGDFLNQAGKSDRQVKFLALSCGLNLELRSYLEKLQGKFDLTIMDSELSFLQQTQMNLHPVLRPLSNKINAHYEHWSSQESLADFMAADARFDLVYSTYLLDHLSDSEALDYLKTIWAGVRKGGKMILGNLAKNFHSALAVELAMNWSVYSRSPQDLLNLAISITETTSGASIETDAEEINFFLVLEKTA